MIAALIIVFREMIEAGLVVGIVLAATDGVARRGRWVGYGVLAGVIGACLVAASAGVISDAFAGAGQELFNAAVLVLAVLMLAWHNVWMSRHGRQIAADVKSVGAAVASGNRTLTALALVVGLAVLREGAEVVLFLYGIAASGRETAGAMAAGASLGIFVGGALSALMYFGLVRIPTRHLFSVTGWLIALLAAGMAAQAIALLQQADVVTALTETAWDTSSMLADSSILGKILHTLIGYADRPSVLQLIVYLLTLITIFTLMRVFGPAARRRPAFA